MTLLYGSPNAIRDVLQALWYASMIFELAAKEILAIMDVLHTLTIKIEGKSPLHHFCSTYADVHHV